MKDKVIIDWTARIERELSSYFEQKDSSSHPLEEAMEYSLLAGGKRIRPNLVMMVCEALGRDPLPLVPITLATEFLHTYSLIHDDLPSMDDDQLRRGKPTNHVIYGEAIAILAGDALQSEAFSILANKCEVTPEVRLTVLREFGDAVGRKGMVGGQAMDLEAENSTINQEHLELLHARKTGALIRFCARMGAHLGGANSSQLEAITTYAEALGLLFQVVDDLLDCKATAEELGKTPGKDKASGKATFPALNGLQETEQMADVLLEKCRTILNNSDLYSDRLLSLAQFVRNRSH